MAKTYKIKLDDVSYITVSTNQEIAIITGSIAGAICSLYDQPIGKRVAYEIKGVINKNPARYQEERFVAQQIVKFLKIYFETGGSWEDYQGIDYAKEEFDESITDICNRLSNWR